MNRRRIAAVAALGASLAFVAAGCGGGSGDGAAAAPTTTTTTGVPTSTTTTTVVLPTPEPPPPDPYAPTPIVEMGSIEIPRIGLTHAIYEGVTLTVLDRGPGHWPGTAQPCDQIGRASCRERVCLGV